MSLQKLETSFTKLVKLAAEFKVDITPGDSSRCVAFASLLLEANESRNLTRLTKPEDLAIGMFLDSLLFNRVLTGAKSVIDIGCGAGFPSVPLALTNPNPKILAVDSRKMKVDFVQESAQKLGLNNLRAKHARVENLTIESCDLVVARAVGSLPKTLTLALPLLKKGGKVVVARSASDLSETLAKCKQQLKKCNVETWIYRLPGYRKDFAQVSVTKGE